MLLFHRDESNVPLSETKRHAEDVAAKLEGLTENDRSTTPAGAST